MPEFLDWPRDYSAELLSRIAEPLRQGRLIVVPSDTVYAVVAHALSPEAVCQLCRLVPDAADRSLLLAEPAHFRDWLPNLAGLGQRLTRHCWPGPLTLWSPAGSNVGVSPSGDPGLASRLPDAARRLLLQGDYLPVRPSGHPLLGQLQRFLGEPLVLGEVPGLTRPEETPAIIAESVALMVQDGPTYFAASSSVVRVDGGRWEMVREGVLSAALLAELAVCRVLFVCTGNTCRSPLAMTLCARLLAENLGCSVRQLGDRGFQVHSAGLAAIIGGEASAEAIEVAQELGGDLRDHRSQSLAGELLDRADFLFTMTRAHLRLLQGLNLEIGPVPRLLSPSGADVVDPIGAEADVYRRCAQQILGCLRQRVPEIIEGSP